MASLYSTQRPLIHLLIAAATMALLGLVFGLYLQPDFMVMLADQAWACM